MHSIKESGQSLVELSAMMVILLILLAGVVDLGRLAFYYIAMRDAAQEAASYASIFPNNNQEIFNRAFAGMNQLDNPSEITVVFYKSTDNINDDPYSCAWKLSETKPACVENDDTADDNSNVVSPGDVVEIKITNENFLITMPFIGPYIGATENNTITVDTKIQDVVVRVQKNN